jgi:hypothetical protein
LPKVVAETFFRPCEPKDCPEFALQRALAEYKLKMFYLLQVDF